MHLLYCDESNLEHRAGDFLVYGGVVIPSDRVADLSERIARLRRRAGIAPVDLLKFNPVLNPLDHDSFRDLKQAVIQEAIDHECKLLAYAVLHDLAGNPDMARSYGINTICYHFHCVLNRIGGHGMVLVDRFNDAGRAVDAQMREKLWQGVKLPHRQQPTALTNIVGYHYSAIGQSHFTSLIDILIGSLRFAMNVHCRIQRGQRANALALLSVMAPLFFREPGQEQVPDIGLVFSPMNVRMGAYHRKYIALQNFLREAGIDSNQVITNNARAG